MVTVADSRANDLCSIFVQVQQKFCKLYFVHFIYYSSVMTGRSIIEKYIDYFFQNENR